MLISEGIKTNTQAAIIKDFDTHFVASKAIELPISFTELIYQIKEEKPSKTFAESYLADAANFYKKVDVFRKNIVTNV